MLKKLILNPQRDTITICLPPEWVGKPLTCILKSSYDMQGDIVSQVSEDSIQYQRVRFSRRKQHLCRSRRKRR